MCEIDEHDLYRRLDTLDSKIDYVCAVLEQRVKQVLTVDEAAQLVRREPDTVRRWIRDGRLLANKTPDTGLHGPWFIQRADLIAFASGRGRAINGIDQLGASS